MIAKKQVPAALLRLAARQGGVLTYAQATSALGERRCGAGHLLGGADSALGGRAALFLAGVGDAPPEVDVWVPAGVKRRDRPGWRFHRDGLGRLDRTLGSLPRIRAEEALIDVGQGLDVEGWVEVLSEAVRRGIVALAEMLARIDRRAALTNRALLRDVAVDLQGVESTLEWVYLTEVERAHGLPEGRRQARVTGPWRCDVHYDGYRLVVEVDGQVHLKRVFRDLERDNAHALRDQTTLRYGSVDLRGRRGWPGAPVPCPQCPPAEEREAWLVPID